MSTLSLILFWTCVSYAVYHLAWAVWFRIYLPISQPKHKEVYQPRAMVILSLRGKDPFVCQTIRQLLNQDYPDYQLRIIVDSEGDPVWQTLQHYEGHPRLKISVLENRLKTCSLKCSAIVQALTEVPEGTEVIALVDADIAPDRTWLQTIVNPLQDQSIGVVTGNQWFSPRKNRAGSMIRSLWNAGAIVVSFLCKHTWAGSCAMRLEDVRNSGLIDRWRKTIVDDGPIDGAMRELSVKTVFVADLITVNQEECDLPFSIQYNTRMLTWSRIYEWGFVGTFLHMLFTVAMVLTTIVVVGMDVIAGQLVGAGILASGLISIPLLMFLAYVLTENTMKVVSPRLAMGIAPMTISRAVKFVALIPLALVVYSISTMRAAITRTVKWRNVTYEIRNKFEIRLLDDQPFTASALPVDQTTSI